MIVLCSVAAAGPEVQPACCRECYITLFLLSCIKSVLFKWFCLCQKIRELKAHLPALTFFLHHLASSLWSHESKIDRHIVQQLYLRANCHFAWVQNAYYGCTASIWNDCRLQTQWLVTVAGGCGMSLSLLHSLSLSLSLSVSEHQTHNPPTPALANSPSLTHNQILFNPNQPTDLGIFKYSCDPPVVI